MTLLRALASAALLAGGSVAATAQETVRDAAELPAPATASEAQAPVVDTTAAPGHGEPTTLEAYLARRDGWGSVPVQRKLIAAAPQDAAVSAQADGAVPAVSHDQGAPSVEKNSQTDAPSGEVAVMAAPEAPAPVPEAGAAPSAQSIPAASVSPLLAAVRERLAGEVSARRRGNTNASQELAAYYDLADARPLFADESGPTAAAEATITEIRDAEAWGLAAADFRVPKAPDAALSGPERLQALADWEIAMAREAFRYAQQARTGRIDLTAVSRLHDRDGDKITAAEVLGGLGQAADPGAFLRSQHPQHEQFGRLKEALAAARRSQPAQVSRILINMERWRALPRDLGDFHVWDSVPEKMTRVFKDGEEIHSAKIIVGKPTTPTFIFSADMTHIVFHPSWGVPPGIKRNDLLPRLRKYSDNGGWWLFGGGDGASRVLQGQNLTVTRNGARVDPDKIDWKTADISSFHFSQAPGPTNVLGVVKFMFPNRHDIYMHDTPERHLFDGANRMFSAGCVRVKDPLRFAEVILGETDGWSAAQVSQAVRSGRSQQVNLSRPVPVHITYFTARVADDGRLLTFPDIYSLDVRTARALGVPPPGVAPEAAQIVPPLPKKKRQPAGDAVAAVVPPAQAPIETGSIRGEADGSEAAGAAASVVPPQPALEHGAVAVETGEADRVVVPPAATVEPEAVETVGSSSVAGGAAPETSETLAASATPAAVVLPEPGSRDPEVLQARSVAAEAHAAASAAARRAEVERQRAERDARRERLRLRQAEIPGGINPFGF